MSDFADIFAQVIQKLGGRDAVQSLLGGGPSALSNYLRRAELPRNKMAIINTKIYDQKVKVQKIRTTCTKGKKMNLAGILLFIIWVSFVILSVMGWTLKTINEIKWDMDEIDKDNVL